ncbi:hypothetical protein DFH06DRAFT_1152194 [Mycena polygramma]|nr:hypothetical protein DFH06DRAFT_1152194 [Mycena polygramma]
MHEGLHESQRQRSAWASSGSVAVFGFADALHVLLLSPRVHSAEQGARLWYLREPEEIQRRSSCRRGYMGVGEKMQAGRNKIKSPKPHEPYTLAVHPADFIATVKERLAAQPNGPPVAAQRLSLKGKALALVKEPPLADGDTVNLVLKALPATSPTSASPPTPDKDTPTLNRSPRPRTLSAHGKTSSARARTRSPPPRSRASAITLVLAVWPGHRASRR